MQCTACRRNLLYMVANYRYLTINNTALLWTNIYLKKIKKKGNKNKTPKLQNKNKVYSQPDILKCINYKPRHCINKHLADSTICVLLSFCVK